MANGGTLLSLVLCHLNLGIYLHRHRNYYMCVQHILTNECYTKFCDTSKKTQL